MPYTYWKQSQTGSGGQSLFILGLQTNAKARPVQARVVPPSEPEPVSPAPAREGIEEREATPEPAAPREEEGGYREPKSNVAPGSFSELRQLMPKAGPLLQGLEAEGWTVSKSNRYDRPGQRFSRDFILNNGKSRGL